MDVGNEPPPEADRQSTGKDAQPQRKGNQKTGEHEASGVDALIRERDSLKRRIDMRDFNIEKLREDAIQVAKDRHEEQLAAERERIVLKYTTFRDSIRDERSSYFHGEDKFMHVDLNSPLHWDSRCEWCETPLGVGKARAATLRSIWPRCHRRFENLRFMTLREYAICRSIIERAENITAKELETAMEQRPLPAHQLTETIVEQTIRATCEHARRAIAVPKDGWRFRVSNVPPHLERAYRLGLGEAVDVSVSFGAILHRPGLPLSDRGGDSSHWEWQVVPDGNWEAIIENWISGLRRLKKVLIFWPRDMSLGRMKRLRCKLIECMTAHAWVTVIVPEPVCAETPRFGAIRVILDGAATDDGTAVAHLQQTHPWMRRDHWEFAAEAWSEGRRWNPMRARQELTSRWGFVIVSPEEAKKEERRLAKNRKKSRQGKMRRAKGRQEKKKLRAAMETVEADGSSDEDEGDDETMGKKNDGDVQGSGADVWTPQDEGAW